MRKGKPAVVWSAPYPDKVVIRKEFRYPDGETREFFFWGKEGGGPVIIFPVTEDGRVLITKQWRAASDSFVYELPGGHPNKKQSVKDAIAAELREETGYQAQIVIPLPEFWLDPPSMHNVIRPFLALGCKRIREPDLDKDEFMTHMAIPLKKWLKLVMSRGGRNTKDSKSLSVTFLALPELIARGLIKKSAPFGAES